MKRTNHKKGHLTRSPYMEWDKLLGLTRNLEKDGKYLLASYISLAMYTGLRFSDVRTISYNQIIGQSKFTIQEKKTGKTKEIDVNDDLSEKITKYFRLLNRTNPNGLILESPRIEGESVTISYINKQLKKLNFAYGLKHKNFTSHTLRRSFAHRIYTAYGSSEHSLVLLSKMFSHSSVSITREYIGLEQEEISEVYLNL